MTVSGSRPAGCVGWGARIESSMSPDTPSKKSFTLRKRSDGLSDIAFQIDASTAGLIFGFQSRIGLSATCSSARSRLSGGICPVSRL